MECEQTTVSDGTPQTGTKLRGITYRIIEGNPIRLTISVGNAQITGPPDVRLRLDNKDPCKSDNPFVWIIDNPDMHGKTLHCTINLSHTPGISPSEVYSLTYTLEGGHTPKQWITQETASDIEQFPVTFEADIYLHTD